MAAQTKSTSRKTAAPRESRATSAHYDAAGSRIIVELTTGYLLGIPLTQFPEISDASPTDLSAVEVLGAGNILHWESLDADYSVPALIGAAVGRTRAAREFARLGGQARTYAKAAAARANGRKGGRPRKS